MTTTHTNTGIAEAEEFHSRHPYCIARDIELIGSEKKLPQAERERLSSRIAASLGSDDQRLRILGNARPDFDTFYPDQLPVRPTTDETIDTFLATYGSRPDSRETEILERAMFAPSTGFEAAFAASAADEEMPDDPTARGIDSFLGAHAALTGKAQPEIPAPEPSAEPRQPRATKTRSPRKPSASDSALTESLVKVMVKNGNYAKALEIISDLSLANPQKMIYFADQIRFLKKLIVNQKYKKLT